MLILKGQTIQTKDEQSFLLSLTSFRARTDAAAASLVTLKQNKESLGAKVKPAYTVHMYTVW